MDLIPYEGGFLQPGLHWARIVEFENVEANSGTRGVKITFESNGKTVNSTYWMYDPEGKPSKAIWRLAALCIAAGLTEDERKDFHSVMLQGKFVGIAVKPQDRNPDYCEVGTAYSEKEYAFQTMGEQQIPKPEKSPEAPTESNTPLEPEPEKKEKKVYTKGPDNDCPF